jgi:hypothetical protein
VDYREDVDRLTSIFVSFDTFDILVFPVTRDPMTEMTPILVDALIDCGSKCERFPLNYQLTENRLDNRN